MGTEPWLDVVSLLPGADWEHTIRQALLSSTHCIALISRHSVNKRGFVQKEVRQALDILQELPPGRIFLIPVRLENIEPKHEELKRIHRVDLFGNRLLALSKIAESMNLRLNRAGTNSFFKHTSKRVDLDELEAFISAKLQILPFPLHDTYDGFVINFDLKVDRYHTDTSQGLHIQGASQQDIRSHVELVAAEMCRRGEGSVYEAVQKLLPARYKLCQIDLRIIFDHHGRMTYLQSVRGQVIGPDKERRPLRRVLEEGD